MGRILRALRMCFCCLKRAFERGGDHAWASAQEECDSFCAECEEKQEICAAHAQRRSPWHYTNNPCGSCVGEVVVCTHLFAVFASMDQCGSQHALVSRVTLRNSEVVPAPMQVARAEVGHKRVRMEPVRLSDQARYQELRDENSNKSYTT
jgi:hypothetical protein